MRNCHIIVTGVFSLGQQTETREEITYIPHLYFVIVKNYETTKCLLLLFIITVLYGLDILNQVFIKALTLDRRGFLSFGYGTLKRCISLVTYIVRESGAMLIKSVCLCVH